MYTLATRKHLFTDSYIMETYRPWKLKSKRKKIYGDRSGSSLSIYVKKVEDNIQDTRLKDIIIACLTAGRDDHGKIYGLFKRDGAYNG